jgi:hypothetical protein
MRRLSIGLITGIIIGLLASTAGLAVANTPIKLLINGNYIQCDVPPQNINGRVLVPARFVAESLGATVSWDSTNQTVVINGAGYVAPASTVQSEEKNQPPVTIEQLPVKINIQRPDSIGNVYMDATYTNNSSRNITGFQITVLLKDSNEEVYLSCYDTTLPGDRSPKFKTFGPKTQNMSDIQFISYEITIANADGSKTHLTYDPKLKNYSWF